MDLDHEEAQTAATGTGEPAPGAYTGDPNPDPGSLGNAIGDATAGGDHATGGGKPRKRRKVKRTRARRVAPAEPGARDAAARDALAQLAPEPPAEPEAPSGEAPVCDACGLGPGECQGHDAEPDPDALAALAAGSVPLLRLAIKGLALAIRRRFPGGAAAMYERADAHAQSLAETIGVRLAAKLGPVLPVVAVVAEFAEPFLADRWTAGAK